jgi:hypothetical protein
LSLRYKDLLDIFIQRADRLGLVDPSTSRTDAAELELYLFQALLSIIEMEDLNDYTIRNENILVTQAGVDNYSAPDDFGRLIAPRVRNRRGIYLNDTAVDHDLEYIDPNIFVRQSNGPQGVPSQFTVMRRRFFLSPTPDANGANNYKLRGIYIERAGRPDMQDDVPLAFPTVLTDEAIFILAGDMGKMNSTILTRRTEAMVKLMGSPLGNADRISRNMHGTVAG